MEEEKNVREMTLEERWMAIGFLKSEMNFQKCADTLGFSRQTIRNLYNKFQTTGNVNDLPRSGRPTSMTDETKKEAIKNIQQLGESTRTIA